MINILTDLKNASNQDPLKLIATLYYELDEEGKHRSIKRIRDILDSEYQISIPENTLWSWMNKTFKWELRDQNEETYRSIKRKQGTNTKWKNSQKKSLHKHNSKVVQERKEAFGEAFNKENLNFCPLESFSKEIYDTLQLKKDRIAYLLETSGTIPSTELKDRLELINSKHNIGYVSIAKGLQIALDEITQDKGLEKIKLYPQNLSRLGEINLPKISEYSNKSLL